MATATKAKSILQSKTMWFSGLTGIAGLFALADKLPWATISPQWGGAVLLGLGTITAVLRSVTTGPVGTGKA